MKRKFIERYVGVVYIVFLTIMFITLCLKTNFHVDEVYSYGLSNNVEGISIEFDDGIEYNPISVYLDYVSTDEMSRFNYINVWKNQIKDVHPPLYYILLHTICSFFPDTFSIWYAGVINIAFALATLYVARKLLMLLLPKKEMCELLSYAFIFTTGILSAVTFLRMYVIAMFWVTLLTFLFVSSVHEEVLNAKWYGSVFLVTVLGALTHYYCIVYAVLLSFVYGLYLIFDRKKSFCRFCGTMISAGGISVLLFPAMIKHMFFNYRGKEALDNISNIEDYWIRLKSFWGFVNQQMFGGMLTYILIAGVFGVVLLILRYNGKILDIFRKYKDESVKFILLLIPSIFYYLLVSKIAAYQTDRYLFPIYAVSFVGVMCLIIKVIDSIWKAKEGMIICIILSLITVGTWKGFNWPYLYRNTENTLQKASLYKDVNCICFYDKAWRTQSLFYEAINYKSITFVEKNDWELVDELLDDSVNEVVIMMCGVDDKTEYINRIMQEHPFLSKYEKISGNSYDLYSEKIERR